MSARVGRGGSPTPGSPEPIRADPLTREQNRTNECGHRVLRRRRLNFDTPPPRTVMKTPSPLKEGEGKEETPETSSPKSKPGAWFYDNFDGLPPGSPGFSPITNTQENSKSIDAELWGLLEAGFQEKCIELIEQKGGGAIANVQFFLDKAKTKGLLSLYATLKTASPFPSSNISPIQSGTEASLDEPWDPKVHRTYRYEELNIEEKLADAFVLGNEEQCLQILCSFENRGEVPSADEFFSQAVDKEWWWAAQLLANHISETFNDESTMVLCMLRGHTEIIATVLQRSKAVRDTALAYLLNMENLGVDFPEISNLFFVVSQLSAAVQFGNQEACSKGLQTEVPVIPCADDFFAEAVKREWWPEAGKLAHHISEKFRNDTTICFCIAADQVEILATILERSAVARSKIDVYLQALKKTDTVNKEILDLFLQKLSSTEKLMKVPSPLAGPVERLPVERSFERGFTPPLPSPKEKEKTEEQNRIYSHLFDDSFIRKFSEPERE